MNLKLLKKIHLTVKSPTYFNLRTLANEMKINQVATVLRKKADWRHIRVPSLGSSNVLCVTKKKFIILHKRWNQMIQRKTKLSSSSTACIFSSRSLSIEARQNPNRFSCDGIQIAIKMPFCFYLFISIMCFFFRLNWMYFIGRENNVRSLVRCDYR